MEKGEEWTPTIDIGLLWVMIHRGKVSDYSLLLKPLSTITDEEAYYIAKIDAGSDISEDVLQSRVKHKDVLISALNGRGDYEGDPVELLHVFQYLKSRGYALPYLQWSVEDLVKQGLYTLCKDRS